MKCSDSTQLVSDQLRREEYSLNFSTLHRTFPLTQNDVATMTYISPLTLQITFMC